MTADRQTCVLHDVIELGEFSYRWPKDVEQFDRGWEAEVELGAYRGKLRHGLGARHVYGSLRRHSVTWLDGQPVVEGVAADDYQRSRGLLSLLRVDGRRLVRSLDDVADGYEAFQWVEHRAEIDAPWSKRCLAVKIRDDDLEAWATHAVLRRISKKAQPRRPGSKPGGDLTSEIPTGLGAATDESRVQALVRALLDFGRRLQVEGQDGGPKLSGDAARDRLLREDPFAFLVAVLFDQGIVAKRAWAAPYELRERLGHLDPARLVAEPERLAAAMARTPRLHRFVPTMTRWTIAAAERVSAVYHGEAGGIWGDRPTARELQRRLEAFHGIGQKKAAMAVEILERDLGVPIRDMKGSDVAYDVHVRRVLLRSGIAQRDEARHMIETVRELYPRRPGQLDHPLWAVGRRWCHPEGPECEACVLGSRCLRLPLTIRGV